MTRLRQLAWDALILSKGYWGSEERWSARLLLTAIIGLHLGLVGVNVLQNRANLYAGFGSTIAHLIGRPLIRLNNRQQAVEADFRFSLVRLREEAEGIALYGGEAQERGIALYGGEAQERGIALGRKRVAQPVWCHRADFRAGRNRRGEGTMEDRAHAASTMKALTPCRSPPDLQVSPLTSLCRPGIPTSTTQVSPAALSLASAPAVASRLRHE
jgi:hypothetical protein